MTCGGLITGESVNICSGTDGLINREGKCDDCTDLRIRRSREFPSVPVDLSLVNKELVFCPRLKLRLSHFCLEDTLISLTSHFWCESPAAFRFRTILG